MLKSALFTSKYLIEASILEKPKKPPGIFFLPWNSRIILSPERKKSPFPLLQTSSQETSIKPLSPARNRARCWGAGVCVLGRLMV